MWRGGSVGESCRVSQHFTDSGNVSWCPVALYSAGDICIWDERSHIDRCVFLLECNTKTEQIQGERRLRSESELRIEHLSPGFSIFLSSMLLIVSISEKGGLYDFSVESRGDSALWEWDSIGLSRVWLSSVLCPFPFSFLRYLPAETRCSCFLEETDRPGWSRASGTFTSLS